MAGCVLTKHGADWRAVHEIQFGGISNVSSSINVSASSPTAHAGVRNLEIERSSWKYENIVMLQKMASR